MWDESYELMIKSLIEARNHSSLNYADDNSVIKRRIEVIDSIIMSILEKPKDLSK